MNLTTESILLTSLAANFLVAFELSACVLTILFVCPDRSDGRWARVGLTLGVLASGVFVASHALPDRNSVVSLLQHNRLETLSGCLTGVLVALVMNISAGGVRQRLAGLVLYLGIACLHSYALVHHTRAALVQPSWDESFKNGPSATLQAPVGFEIEEYGSLDFTPTCMTLGPDDRLYVAGLNGDINWNGMVVRLDPTGEPGKLRATEVAAQLVRPFGLAFRGDELYVSRSGAWSTASHGCVTQFKTGAVTRLVDLDGDGIFDYYDDVIRDLPGALNLLQNNGIVFDGQGYLYVTVGARSDHSPVLDPYEGTILRARPDGTDLRVWARGLRNPFDIVLGPDGAIFATDNDSESRNAGNSLFHIKRGEHYGFPYTEVSRSLSISGAMKSLDTNPNDVFEGLAYAAPGKLPAPYDDCLYVACLGSGQVKRVKLQRNGGTYLAALETFAKIPFPLDIAISEKERAMYVVSGYNQRKVYRIMPTGPKLDLVTSP